MLPTQETIDHLAGRIERAFHRRCATWNRGCSTQRVWSAAAIKLLRAHQESPDLPVDPELFVASQPIHGLYSDPWSDLTRFESVRRYARRVRGIIRLLRAELTREVARADRLIDRGGDLSRIISSRKPRLSALACYIVALKAGRDDLADELHDKALEQHRSCPLYRIACSGFLPDDFYPGEARGADRTHSAFAASIGVRDAMMN